MSWTIQPAGADPFTRVPSPGLGGWQKQDPSVAITYWDASLTTWDNGDTYWDAELVPTEIWSKQ